MSDKYICIVSELVSYSSFQRLYYVYHLLFCNTYTNKNFNEKQLGVPKFDYTACRTEKKMNF